MTGKPKTLRYMDDAVWIRARIAAIKRGKSLAAWLTEAIRAKLRKENG